MKDAHHGRNVALSTLGLLAFTAVLQAAIFGIGNQFIGDAEMVALVPGLTQLVYVVPLVVVTGVRGQTAILQGVLLGAAITVLLNGACWAVVISALSRM
ncbi:MAG: hypothetical protein H6739_12285 [Alphaproteobacteria bacterium]|nr:hypothetical protein [Alphaproteobacteria bacterium]